MGMFQKAWATKLSLIIIPVLLLSVFLSFQGGTASAASVTATHASRLSSGTNSAYSTSLSTSRQMSLRPNTSGGGCRSNAIMVACISINSNNVVVSDAYSKAYVCKVFVVLYRNNAYLTNNYFPNCYPAGSYFPGPTAANGLFVTWQSKAIANGVGVLSPIQYS